MTERTSSFAGVSLGDFTAALGEKTPVPGGGAAAGSALAHGAALGEMVLSFSLGKKAFADQAALLDESASMLRIIRTRALELADEDARGFAELSATWTMSPEPSVADQLEAIRVAIAPPIRIIEDAREAAEILERLVGRSNPRLVSDLAIAAGFVALAAEAAEWNVKVNLESIHALVPEDDPADDDARRSGAVVTRTRSICDRIVEACRTAPTRTIVD